MATGSFNGEVQGLNELQAQEQSQYGPGNYMPNVRVIYWSMRAMAYMGVLMLLVAAVGAWLYWKKKSSGRAGSSGGDRGDGVSLHRRDGGLILTEMGRQPWIVQGLLKTADAHSPAVSSTMLAFSLTVFVGLYLLLLVLDIWLMRRYAKLDLPEVDRDETGETAMPCDRILRWTCKSSGSA